MYKTFKEFGLKLQVIKEDLINLASNIEERDEFDIEIKNQNALNTDEELNYLVVKVNRGNLKDLVEKVTSIYNFTAEINEKQKTVIFKRN